MIITLTPNTGIDHTLQVSSFHLNQTIRAAGSAWGMGGKATDVSWILGKLAVPTRALGFAAGPNGLRMDSMLHERGVETDFIWVEGETRLNTVLIVPGEGQSTITTSSLEVSPKHLSEFVARYEKALEFATCVVMGGSLPSGVPVHFYRDAIVQAHAHGVPVIFDSSGPSLAEGIKGRPDLIKPNQAELHDLLGYSPSSRQEVQQATQELCEQLGISVIVTLGGEGAIAVFREDSYFIHPLSLNVVSSAGAGDGVLAGMALAFDRKESLVYGFQHGFALAGAILQTLATADFRIEDYQELLSQIKITPL
jgi:1-phosphofructokinase family hexose kinase